MSRAVFRALGFEFSRAVFGLQQRTPRWKSCTANVNANFGVALSYLYVKRHFDQDSREKVGSGYTFCRLAKPLVNIWCIDVEKFVSIEGLNFKTNIS